MSDDTNETALAVTPPAAIATVAGNVAVDANALVARCRELESEIAALRAQPAPDGIEEVRVRLRYALDQIDARTAEIGKLQAEAVTAKIALEDANADRDAMRARAEKAEAEAVAAMAVVDRDAVTQHPMEVQKAKDAHAAEVAAHAETRDEATRGRLRNEALHRQLFATERDRDAHAKRADDAQAALLLAGDARVKRAVDLVAARRAELEGKLPRLQQIARGHRPADWTGEFTDSDVHEAARQIPVIVAELDKLG